VKVQWFREWDEEWRLLLVAYTTEPWSRTIGESQKRESEMKVGNRCREEGNSYEVDASLRETFQLDSYREGRTGRVSLHGLHRAAGKGEITVETPKSGFRGRERRTLSGKVTVTSSVCLPCLCQTRSEPTWSDGPKP